MAAMPVRRENCPVCNAEGLEPFCEIASVPVFCNVLSPTAAEARATARGDMALAVCARCGHVYNTAFRPELVAYNPEYENSLHFSPRFREYARELIADLLARHDLEGGTVVEIGCGKGEFLAELSQTAGAKGVGYDRSYDPARLGPPAANIRVVNENFGPAARPPRADLVCCRHVFEHVADPVGFLRSVRAAVTPGTPVFFEVPNALYTLEDLGIWDLIYEHCSYFSPQSLARAFAAADFAVNRIWTTFESQFLCIEARAAHAGELPRGIPGPSPPDVAALARRFAAARADKLAAWSTRLGAMFAGGRQVAVWGAGSKGVSFLNLVPGAECLRAVVDVNPNKTGRFVAGTGHAVVAPDALRDKPVDDVLVMNPIYEAEINGQLTALGVPALTHVV